MIENKKNYVVKKYQEKIKKHIKEFEIYVDLDKFKPNASSLIYAGNKNAIIGWASVDDFEIVFEAVGDVRIYDSNTNKYYYNEMTDYMKNTLITGENIEGYGCTIEESNCFEIRYLKKRTDGTYEYYGGSDEIFDSLNGSYEQLIDILYSETIYFLQDFI